MKITLLSKGDKAVIMWKLPPVVAQAPNGAPAIMAAGTTIGEVMALDDESITIRTDANGFIGPAGCYQVAVSEIRAVGVVSPLDTKTRISLT